MGNSKLTPPDIRVRITAVPKLMLFHVITCSPAVRTGSSAENRPDQVPALKRASPHTAKGHGESTPCGIVLPNTPD